MNPTQDIPTSHKLPNVRIEGERGDSVCYDANDVASFYLHCHWRADFYRWRSSPYNRLVLKNAGYRYSSTRNLFRTFLAECVLHVPYSVPEYAEIIDTIMTNTFKDSDSYVKWANGNAHIRSVQDIPFGTNSDIKGLLAILPPHGRLLHKVNSISYRQVELNPVKEDYDKLAHAINDDIEAYLNRPVISTPTKPL